MQDRIRRALKGSREAVLSLYDEHKETVGGLCYSLLLEEKEADHAAAFIFKRCYVNDETPGIFTLNRNYQAYQIDIETGGALSFPGGKVDHSWTIFNEETVRRLAVEDPDLMPFYPKGKAIERGIDLAYGKKQITNTVTSAILQGKSVKGIADDLQSRIPDMNRASAIRTARTSITGAQNGGRQDTYQSAVKMGIKMKKQWLATLDSRTRHSHAMLDGEIIEVGGKYSNGCRYPGDPRGKPHEIYNCRCTEIAVLDDVDTSDAKRRARDPETGESVLIDDMNYADWLSMNGLKSAGTDGKIITGARIKDPYSPRANAHAERYYGLIRSMKNDVRKIAENTGLEVLLIEQIKNYLFNEKHDLGGTERQRFDPDFAIAQSWQRLISGKTEQHDITLLKHEELERKLISKGMSQFEAHIKASEKHNYSKEVREYYASLNKHKN